MIQEFVRFKSSDNIEMCGVLYKPFENSDKTIIHLHGLAGNFYENRFISYLAKAYTNKGYNFLTFNNRGNNYFCDLRKEDKEVTSVAGGGAYEVFSECVYDIQGAIDFMKAQGTNEVVLQGHSYGCNKVIYYYDKKKDNIVSKIILLAPCDVVEEMKVFIDDKYDNCVKQAKNLISNNKGSELIDCPLFPMTFTANTFINDFSENSEADIYRYREENYIHQALSNLDIPVLIEVGTDDSCVLVVDKSNVDNYFKNNLKNYKINYIENAPHSYYDCENKLVNDIVEWL